MFSPVCLSKFCLQILVDTSILTIFDLPAMVVFLAAGVIASLASLDLVAGASLPLTAVPAEERAGFVLKELLPLSEAAHVVDVGRDEVFTEVVEKLKYYR